MTDTMKRTNFAFRYDWNLAIAHLAPEYRLEIIEATIRYAETGETGPLTDIAAEAFRSFILPDFERRRKSAERRARSKARKISNDSSTADSVPSEASEKIDELPMAKTLPGPNRRERRLLEAQEKRLQKKRRRNAAARAKHAAETPAPPTPVHPTHPPVYTPFWL